MGGSAAACGGGSSRGGTYGGGVYRTDYHWQDPQFLFYPKLLCPEVELGCQGESGIAYDPTNNSLWIRSKPNPWIADYSLDGVLLAAFDTGNRFPYVTLLYNAALGLDPFDHTLWLSMGGTNLLAQYSLDGATFGDLLQIGTPSGLPFGGLSGEFQEPVPEPATFALLLAVIAVIGSGSIRRPRMSSQSIAQQSTSKH